MADFTEAALNPKNKAPETAFTHHAKKQINNLVLQSLESCNDRLNAE